MTFGDKWLRLVVVHSWEGYCFGEKCIIYAFVTVKLMKHFCMIQDDERSHFNSRSVLSNCHAVELVQLILK